MFTKKSKIVKAMAVVLAFCLTMGIAQKTVMASGCTSFPYIFNGGSGIPSSASHITQTVEVQCSGDEYVHAKCTEYSYTCTEYSYTGDAPVLTIQSITAAFPTTTVSFTGTGTKIMTYTSAVPASGKTITFQGTVTNYSTYFTIVAALMC